MRATIPMLAIATALAGCSVLPFGDGGGDISVTTPPPAAAQKVASADEQIYEIKYTTRGLAHLVKVTLNGRTIDTLSMSRSRTESSSHCCTADGCEEIPAAKACMAFKMTCDKDGTCSGSTVRSGGH
jgi:hypothetical protein